MARETRPAKSAALIQERELRDSNALAEQLQAALDSRILIEQAKGMLARHFTIPADNAFQVIRKYARGHNRKVADVAADIVSGKIASQDLITPHDQQP